MLQESNCSSVRSVIFDTTSGAVISMEVPVPPGLTIKPLSPVSTTPLSLFPEQKWDQVVIYCHLQAEGRALGDLQGKKLMKSKKERRQLVHGVLCPIEARFPTGTSWLSQKNCSQISHHVNSIRVKLHTVCTLKLKRKRKGEEKRKCKEQI